MNLKKNSEQQQEESKLLSICEACRGSGKAKTVNQPVDVDPKKEKNMKELIKTATWVIIDCPICRGTGRFSG